MSHKIPLSLDSARSTESMPQLNIENINNSLNKYTSNDFFERKTSIIHKKQSNSLLQSERVMQQRVMCQVPLPLIDVLPSDILFSEHYLMSKNLSLQNKSQSYNITSNVFDLSASDYEIKIHINSLINHFLAEGKLIDDDAIRMVQETKNILKCEPNVLHLSDPIVIVGDIHGQFYDLIKLFKLNGIPPKEKYLFLGDYVDRGCFSCEVILLLFGLKINYPDQIYLLRGNHESRSMTGYFTFKSECLIKYGSLFYKECMDCFDCLPLAATVNKHIFCTHAGLSPQIMDINEINILYRFREIPNEGAMCDLLWSDPTSDVQENNTNQENGSMIKANFYNNNIRGCSFNYNFGTVREFINMNSLSCIIRAHEVQDEGYQLYRVHPLTKLPSLISIFSAPNYCDIHNNKGAVLKIDSNQFIFRQFYSSPHPFVLPNYLNAFEWSLPYLKEKLIQIFSVINECVDEQIDDCVDDNNI